MHDDPTELGQRHLCDVVGELPGVGGLGPGFEGGAVMRPPVPPPGEHPAGVPDSANVTLKSALLYSSGNFGSSIFYSFNNFIQTTYLKGLGASPIVYGLLGSQRSLEGSIIQPLIGAWSDRTWNRLGRRRPFIVWFMPISVVLIIATPFLPQFAGLGKGLGLSESTAALILVAASIFLFSVFFNIVQDPYTALLADITPEPQRGKVNGIFQAVGAAGQVAILLAALLLGVPYTILFIVTALSLAIFFLPTLFGIREPRVLRGAATHRRYTLQDYWEGLRGDKQVLLYFTCQAFLWFGINAIVLYITPFGLDILHFSKSRVFVLPLILLLSTSIFVWPFGILADRLGLKRVFLLGMVCMAVSALAAIVVRDQVLIYAVLTLAGIGNAAQTASSYPLLTRMVFPDRMGLYTGLNSTVTSVAAPLSSLVAGGLVSIPVVGYNLLFPFVAAMFVICLAPLALLRVEDSAFARAKRAEAGDTPVAAG
jgi:Na+/melibiose symporter-like transporter